MSELEFEVKFEIVKLGKSYKRRIIEAESKEE
jgi:hypothetical protein